MRPIPPQLAVRAVLTAKRVGQALRRARHKLKPRSDSPLSLDALVATARGAGLPITSVTLSRLHQVFTRAPQLDEDTLTEVLLCVVCQSRAQRERFRRLVNDWLEQARGSLPTADGAPLTPSLFEASHCPPALFVDADGQRRLARGLGRRRVPQILNPQASVTATARAQGASRLVFAHPQDAPDLWVWVDESAASLSLSRLAEELCAGIERAGGRALRATYNGSPSTLQWVDLDGRTGEVGRRAAARRWRTLVLTDGRLLGELLNDYRALADHERLGVLATTEEARQIIKRVGLIAVSPSESLAFAAGEEITS